MATSPIDPRPRVCFEFEVKKIIGISIDGNYQVQWKPAWVSKFHLVGCQHLMQEFLQQQQHGKEMKPEPEDEVQHKDAELTNPVLDCERPLDISKPESDDEASVQSLTETAQVTEESVIMEMQSYASAEDPFVSKVPVVTSSMRTWVSTNELLEGVAEEEQIDNKAVCQDTDNLNAPMNGEAAAPSALVKLENETLANGKVHFQQEHIETAKLGKMISYHDENQGSAGAVTSTFSASVDVSIESNISPVVSGVGLRTDLANMKSNQSCRRYHPGTSPVLVPSGQTPSVVSVPEAVLSENVKQDSVAPVVSQPSKPPRKRKQNEMSGSNSARNCLVCGKPKSKGSGENNLHQTYTRRGETGLFYCPLKMHKLFGSPVDMTFDAFKRSEYWSKAIEHVEKEKVEKAKKKKKAEEERQQMGWKKPGMKKKPPS